MRAYVITTCVVFGLIALMHLWRAIVEGPQLASDPGFLVLTVLTIALCAWAALLLKRSPRDGS